MLNEKGHEVLDPTPMTLPIGATRPESLQDQIARMVRSAFMLQRQAEGFESPDEADDFNVEDDEGDFSSPWELSADQEAGALELLKAEAKGVIAPVQSQTPAGQAGPATRPEVGASGLTTNT